MRMRPLRGVLQSLCLLFCAALMVPAQSRLAEPADIIVVHGRVYTENSQQPWAQAVAIHRGKIVAVGDDAVVANLRAALDGELQRGVHRAARNLILDTRQLLGETAVELKGLQQNGEVEPRGSALAEQIVLMR